MRKASQRSIPIMLFLLIAAMFFVFGSKKVSASEYYHFNSPKANASFKAGKKISVKMYAGVSITNTQFDAWGNPSSTTYENMPLTFKVFKGSKEIYSKHFTYTRPGEISTSFKPTVTGTLKLCIYGRNYGLGNMAEVLQASINIKVKKASPAAVKKIKPAISVERIAKKKAQISCSNNAGFGMKIYRAAKKKGKYKLIKNSSKATFVDKKVAASKVYYYRVRLFAKKGKKVYLSKWSAPKKAGKYVASADTSPLKVQVANTSKGVKVSWKKYSKAGYYLVSRGTSSSGDGDVLTCNGENELTFTDGKAAKGKTYYYVVSAWYGDDSKPLVKSKPVKIKVQ